MLKKNGFSILMVGILAAFAFAAALVLMFKTKQSPENGPSNQERNLVAIGASFTKANNLSSKMVGDNPEYSFATGTKIESLYLYLKKNGEDVNPKNLAESGADSQKVLSQQVPNAISFQPKYVLIDVMADIFEEERPIKFKKNLTEITKQLKNQDTTILISTYPNLVLMRKAGLPSCTEDKLGLGIDKVTEEKLKLFNEAIQQVAGENSLILVDNFTTLGPGDVSDYDCLHPNIEGQKKLAQTWISVLKKVR